MWLILPFTDSDSAPVDSALNSGLKSPCPVIEQPVWWNGKLQSSVALRRAFEKDRSLSLLRGMTLPLSTADASVELFLSSLRDSLASHSPSLGNAPEPPTPVPASPAPAGFAVPVARASAA